MILPTKGIPPDKAVISLGGGILRRLSEPKTVSRLWEETRERAGGAEVMSFDWFVLGLDLLFVLDAIRIDGGKVHKNNLQSETGAQHD
jgi:ABC-three component (ABC-3C) system Middle Component 6